MKIIMTGGSGFIGAHLAHYWRNAGHDLCLILRVGSRLPKWAGLEGMPAIIYGNSFSNLNDQINKFQPDCLVHLAAYYTAEHKSTDIPELISANITFPSLLLEAVCSAGAQWVINTGTSWQHFADEPYNPTCFYAATKQAFDDILRFYEESYGVKSCRLKLFDTYGQNDQRNKLFSQLKNAAENGLPLNMSPGKQVLDLVYIDDVVASYDQALTLVTQQGALCHEYGISGSRHSLMEVVEIYAKILGAAIPVNWGAKDYREREVMLPWTSFQSLPGWAPRYSLEEGLKLMEGI